MNKKILKVIGIIVAVLALVFCCSFRTKSKSNASTIIKQPTIHDELCGFSGDFDVDVSDGKVYCDEYGTIINSLGFPIETYKELSCNDNNEIVDRKTKISLNNYYIDKHRQVHIFEGGDLEW